MCNKIMNNGNLIDLSEYSEEADIVGSVHTQKCLIVAVSQSAVTHYQGLRALTESETVASPRYSLP